MHWTPPALRILRERYGTEPVSVTAMRLGCSRSAVTGKARREGLHKPGRNPIHATKAKAHAGEQRVRDALAGYLASGGQATAADAGGAVTRDCPTPEGTADGGFASPSSLPGNSGPSPHGGGPAFSREGV